MRVNIALLTVTDTRTLKTDKSGNLLSAKIKKAKHNLIDRKICKDNKKDIKKIIKLWVKKKKIDIEISDPDARKHVYGMSYAEWKEKYQK